MIKQKILKNRQDYNILMYTEDLCLKGFWKDLETILSEKIETVLRRTLYNARMKDFYDIYIFLTRLKKEINIEDFKKSFEATLKKRNSLEYLKDYEKIFDEMSNYESLHSNWKVYSRKNKYAENIEFTDIIKILKDFLDMNVKK